MYVFVIICILLVLFVVNKLELYSSYYPPTTALITISFYVSNIGYEPADLTPELPRVGSFFSYRCLVFQKNVLKGKPVLFGIIEVKRPKNVVFQHIHSNPILIILTFLDNNE